MTPTWENVKAISWTGRRTLQNFRQTLGRFSKANQNPEVPNVAIAPDSSQVHGLPFPLSKNNLNLSMLFLEFQRQAPCGFFLKAYLAELFNALEYAVSRAIFSTRVCTKLNSVIWIHYSNKTDLFELCVRNHPKNGLMHLVQNSAGWDLLHPVSTHGMMPGIRIGWSDLVDFSGLSTFRTFIQITFFVF